MRNTAAAWCLFRIFRDLYAFDEPNLTPANYRDLFDKVAEAAAGSRLDRREVLRDRCNIWLGSSPGSPASTNPETPPKSPDDFDYRIDLDHLFSDRSDLRRQPPLLRPVDQARLFRRR